jgi:sugar lactone lactonase YvrE
VTTLAGEFWGEEGLAWSPDGATLLFAANDRRAGDEAHGDLSYQIHSVTIAQPGKSVSALTSGRLHHSRSRPVDGGSHA